MQLYVVEDRLFDYLEFQNHSFKNLVLALE